MSRPNKTSPETTTNEWLVPIYWWWARKWSPQWRATFIALQRTEHDHLGETRQELFRFKI
ncbi:MAG: hypothetical protein H8E66_00800 [Planctomycetes bacterium]|nr:hypothetical protein [Planctomycetota bacterium]